MKKYILIFVLFLPIIFYFTPDISAQTTEENQKKACNSKKNGDACSYQEILTSTGPSINTSKNGFCDRSTADPNNDSNPLICKSGNDSNSWQVCTISGDACKNGDQLGVCGARGPRGINCDTTKKPPGNPGGINPNNSNPNTPSTNSLVSTVSSSTTAGTVSYESYTNFPGVGRISNLCQLITALWYLGFAVLLTSVLGMFLWGGYIYVTAGVNAGKVNQAKEIFTNTITGLIIGLSIFIIINIINPGLLQGNCSIPSVGSGATIGGPAGPSNIIPKPGESVFPVTREYQCPGPRTSFGYARGRLHAGVDLTPPLSTISNSQALQLPILAFRDGTVNEVGGGFGVVGIDHGGGLETRYLHNSKILVSNGQKVTAGQEIAKMGDAGSPGVIHAHFEVYQNNRPVDPAPIIFDSGKNPDPSKVKTTGSPKCVGQNL